MWNIDQKLLNFILFYGYYRHLKKSNMIDVSFLSIYVIDINLTIKKFYSTYLCIFIIIFLTYLFYRLHLLLIKYFIINTNVMY